MNEKLLNSKNKMVSYWNSRTKIQQIMFAGTFLLIVILIAGAVWFASRTPMEPLYSNLTPSETGSIKENLDGRGITSEITDSGTTILVPAEMVNTLKVELAAEGIPESGNIDYSFFSQNAGIGMTDNEFNVMKLDSMQTELANLIKGIEGINDAKVMINLPEEGIFVNQDKGTASVSIVLDTKPGHTFEETQIKSLYHLVSKSVPKLSTENIVIMNQFFEYYDLEDDSQYSKGTKVVEQLNIKKDIERDIQRQVQNMLGTIMGQDKVVVTVTTDIDFSEENREENLVLPVDEENMEGIAVSAQRLTETFIGEGAAAGGIPEAEDASDSLSTYQESTNGNGDYEKSEETINNEVNRIQKEIVESPYKVRDLGIQVMVEPPIPDDPNSLPKERIDDVTQILGSIIRTTINKDVLDEELSDVELESKIAVSVQEFNGKFDFQGDAESAIPAWVYIAGVIFLVALMILILLFMRMNHNSNKKQAEEEDNLISEKNHDIPDVNYETETEGTLRKKQLEKLAKEKPDEFAKLLRTWLTKD
ncbi:MAG: flagellar basal-body MS-ring/collar protein FliF [Bacillus sp. (in: firmicutes)]